MTVLNKPEIKYQEEKTVCFGEPFVSYALNQRSNISIWLHRVCKIKIDYDCVHTIYNTFDGEKQSTSP